MRLLLPTFLFVFLFGCGADCRQATPPVSNVCRAADAGLQVSSQWYSEASCVVEVDAGVITLSLTGSTCSSSSSAAGGGAPVPPLPRWFPCAVPELDGGSWTVAIPGSRLPLDAAPDAGGPQACP